MTNSFASKIIRMAGAVVLASILATSVEAQMARQISFAAPAVPETLVLFFDVESAALTPEAKSIVLSAVDAAERERAGSIELAAYAAPDETVRYRELVARRVAAVKQMIADYGFHGVVVVDDEAADVPLESVGDETIDRRAVIRVGH